jgi:hypothetical protein
VVTREPVSHPIDPTDDTQAPVGFLKALLESSAADALLAEHLLDEPKGLERRERIGMDEEQNWCARDGCPRIHEGGPGGTARPEDL